MVTRSQLRRFLTVSLLLAGFGLSAVAQEVTPEELPPPRPTLSDADNFFIEYGRAAGLVNRGAMAEAALVMEALRQQVTTSPWHELALLKHASLMERRDERVSLEEYAGLIERVKTTGYFYSPEGGRLRPALRAASEHGQARVRVNLVADGLSRYFTRFGRYPTALAELVTHNLLAPADLLGPGQRIFRYLPRTLPRSPHRPMAYDLEKIPVEHFTATTPRIPATSRVGEDPVRYAALIQTSPRRDPEQVVEGQTLEGYFVVVVTARGAVLCTTDRVLIRPVTR